MTIVVLVRHAEPAAGGSDPGLAPAGVVRAATLAKMLAAAEVSAIFTSDLRRTKETAAPLASVLGNTPVVIADDPQAAAAQIKAAGPRVVVVGHSDTTPAIIKALGGPAVSIKPTQFDRMFVLTVPPSSAGSLLSLSYGS
jgi:broad specificity phosphatase PhoE